MPNRREMMLGAGAVLATAGTVHASDSEGWAAAMRLVDATGGAEAWRRISGLRIAARHYETEVEEPYDNLILMDLARPRMRLMGRSAAMDRARVIDGERGVRRSEIRPAGPMTPEQVRGDLDWWEAHVYRNIWRLAHHDPELTPRLGADGRLELYRPDGRRLMWYRLNHRGEPVHFAAFDAEHGTVLGPLGEREGGLRSPVWTTRFDGTFRVSITEWTGLASLDGVDFQNV